MVRTKIDWAHHLAAFKASGLKLSEYCQEAGLNVGTFKFHLYKKPKSKRRREVFHEIAVPSELVITRTGSGELSMRGFDLVQISSMVGAWSDALSQ